MNILLVCPRVPWPLNDGGNIAMYRMAELLASAGNRVTFFALNTRKHSVREEMLPQTIRSRFRIVTVPIDTTIRPWAAFLNLFRSEESYNVARFSHAVAISRLEKLLQEERFDLVQFESVFTGPYLETVRKHSDAICILRAHNVEHLIWQRLAATEYNPVRKSYLGFLSRRLKRYEERLFRRMDGILPVTEVDEQLIRCLAPEVPVRTIPVSIDLAGHPLSTPEDRSTMRLFHIGSMDWQPNREGVHWFLKEAWSAIHERFPHVPLHLAGRAFPEEIRTAAHPMVHCDGTVPDAIHYMQDKQIMLVPLRSGSGMRVKILQGLALGKTIISTSIGAEGIAVRDGKDILIADTPEEFMEKIGECLSNPDRCREIGAAGRRLVEEHYSDAAVSNRLLPFYRELIARQLSMRIV